MTTTALTIRQDQTPTTTDIIEDWQIPAIAHGGRRRIARNHPKLSQQRGIVSAHT